MAIQVYPVRGNGTPKPADLGVDAVAVIAYTLHDSDRNTPLISGRNGDWTLVAFVTGAETRGEARKAVEDWLGLRKVALMATKVGGQAASLDVSEQEPPQPPVTNTRAYDPTLDEPEEDGGGVPDESV